jgi:hypothetical protein
MTGILKLTLVFHILGYILFVITSLLGSINYPTGLGLITFIGVTYSFFVIFAILSSIIEIRERFLDASSSTIYPSKSTTYQSSNTPSQSRTEYVPPAFPKSNRSGLFNIMQSGGLLIEENQMNNGWTCECGFKNQSGTFECINCGKQPR